MNTFDTLEDVIVRCRTTRIWTFIFKHDV